MKLTLQIRLLPDADQRKLLLRTMEAFNAAASYAAKAGFDDGVFSVPSIHARCYYELREKFGLSSQMAVRAIGKAAECFSRDKKRCPVFKPHGAMTYDQRLMSFKGLDRVSLLTLDGRQLIPFVMGEYQRERFDRLKGQCDLVYRDGEFYLLCSIDLPENPPIEIGDFVGVDLGIVNLATTSDGEQFSGEHVENARKRHSRRRRSLGKRMSHQFKRRTRKNARRAMRRTGNKESRFKRHVNHCISKSIVKLAKDTQRGIALEELKGIRSRARFRKSQRARMGGWGFAQLRGFIEYKSKLLGVPVVSVDPRNTSRTCAECGHCEKGNRRNQSKFVCQSCRHTANADHNAARNIRAVAASVNMLEVSNEHQSLAVV